MRRLVNLALAVLLAGCATKPPTTAESLVQVPLILGALKCAFATALMKERNPDKVKVLEGQVAAGTLTLKIVYNRSKDFSLKGKAATGGPFVFAYSGGTASILPNFSASAAETGTLTTTLPFRYYLYATNADVCNQVDAATQLKFGFSDWLAGIISGLQVNSPYSPLGQVDNVQYGADFGVTKTTKGGVDFDIVFLSGSANAASTRNDVQSISFTIGPPSKTNPAPDIWKQTRH
ncbi:hypothetical protein P9272_34345 [Mesorhizobium sp. WSM4976]|uniref:hypothetical protein n=1 Tax=Mesorhizobium sp. WSM4976 TaxID=3038549 RepID=UPI0024175C9A|nr:hypothetical protein [Mesorhizobium sp. WSM4976]MDG4898601.1 hypothetical protein [Mesorhizobium sp. WSM4976]